MAKKLALRQMYCCICFILFFCVMGQCGAVGLVSDCKGSKEGKSDDALYRLDTTNPSITQPLESRNGTLEEYKFVQIEVTEVRNPKKYSLTFQVYFQPKGKDKVYLGSFSLYPSDNPGRFIVATQGKLKDKGAIILSMVLPDKVEPGDTLGVTAKKIKLLKSP